MVLETNSYTEGLRAPSCHLV